ncbi:MAG: hypothetical protein JWM42_1871 [Burkholderia sp.]|nr:hypothetical protein [Burkholderia sp.]
MRFPDLQSYLARLPRTGSATRIWLDEAGRAQGRYFNATLTSAFQPIRRIDAGTIAGVEGYVRSYSASDEGLSLW